MPVPRPSSALMSRSPSGGLTTTGPNRPKTLTEWFRASQQNFSDIQRNGSSSPIVWVPVEGKAIPKNAIVAGEDRRGLLYIARAFYEGGLYIGQAGLHLNVGAVIPFNGREVEVGVYEVAVWALQPMRYGLTEIEYITAPTASPLAAQTLLFDEVMLRRLNEIKTVIIVDDSMSMGEVGGRLWSEAREALAGVAELAAKYDAEGTDVYFLNDKRFELGIKGSTAVRALFNDVRPEGETNIGQKLQEVLDVYIPRLEDRALAHRPITVVVITDGEPTDDPQYPIIEAARRLDKHGVPLNQLRVHFAQIGDDPNATRVLNELSNVCRNFNLRDFVDTTPYHPNAASFTTESVARILLGSIEKVLA
ncbi:hypothetical protein B0H21DRAFT_743167 [Amylocystis lapponica]|nr:hypothetical protein B0H21DRAFT_743167 [Amylocystis lapponica]